MNYEKELIDLLSKQLTDEIDKMIIRFNFLKTI